MKDLSEALYNILQPKYPGSNCENVVESDDITKKYKLVVRSDNIAIKFDGKIFFNTVLGFTPDWDYKH